MHKFMRLPKFPWDITAFVVSVFHLPSFSFLVYKDCVYKIKNNFNKTFEDVHNAKQQEMKRINERNTRIQKISNDLGLQEALIKVGTNRILV